MSHPVAPEVTAHTIRNVANDG